MKSKIFFPTFLAFLFALNCIPSFASDNIYWYQSGFKNNWINSLELSTDNNILLAANYSEPIKIFDANTGSFIKRLIISKSWDSLSLEVCFSKDKNQIITNNLDIYDLNSGLKVGEFNGKKYIRQIIKSNDNKYIGGISLKDTTYYIYNINLTKLVASLKLNKQTLDYHFVFLKDTLAFINDSSRLCYFDILNQKVNEIGSLLFENRDFSLSTDFKSVIMRASSNDLLIFNIIEKKIDTLKNEAPFLILASFSPINPTQFAYANLNKVIIKDINNLSNNVKEFSLYFSPSYIRYSKDGKKLLAYQFDDPLCEIIDLETGKVQSLICQNFYVRNSVFSNDSKKLLTISGQGYSQYIYFQLFDLYNKNKIFYFDDYYSQPNEDKIHAYYPIAINKNGDQCCTPITDEQTMSIGILVVPTDFIYGISQTITLLGGHKNEITTLNFSEDDKYILSGSMDSTIIIWDISKGEIYRTFKFDYPIIEAKLSKDNSKIYAVAGDYYIRKVLIINTNEGSIDYEGEDVNTPPYPGITTTISQNNKYIAIIATNIGTGNMPIYLFNTVKLEREYIPDIELSTSIRDSIRTISITPDEKQIALGFTGKSLSIYNIETGNLNKTLTYSNYSYYDGDYYTFNEEPFISSISFSPDNKFIAGSNIDFSLVIWENTLTGVNDAIPLKNEIKIIPLPADKQFSISYEMQSGGWAEITISDMLGRIVYNNRNYFNTGKQEKTIKCESWSAGVYYVRISTQSGTKCVPVVVTK